MTQNINLYDASLRTRREWLTAAHAAAAVGACVLAVALSAAWSQHELRTLRAPAAQTSEALQAAQQELTALTERMSQTRPDARLQAELQLAQASVAQRQAALALLRERRLGHEDGHGAALTAIARQSIPGLWLTGVALDQQQVALSGRALHPDLIPTYVGRLNQESALQGRSFRALDIARPLLPVAAASAPAQGAAAPPAPSAAYVEFSLVSEHGALAPAALKPQERTP